MSVPEPYFSDGQVGRRSALAEANAAKTHCPHGHEYTEANTYIRRRDNARICKTCSNKQGSERYRLNPRPRVVRQVRATLPTGVPQLDDKIRSTGSCWEWSGSRRSGYGSVKYQGRVQMVHRLVYEILRGSIPGDLVLDHLCRNRACCNPDHLEAVPLRVNVMRGVGAAAINARKEHCRRGHPLRGDNLVPGAKYRQCRICTREASRIKQQKRRAKLRAKVAAL